MENNESRSVEWSEVSAIENLDKGELVYVLSHNKPPLFTEAYHPEIHEEDVAIIIHRALAILEGQVSGVTAVDGGDAVCIATRERLAIREAFPQNDFVAVDESGLVHSIGSGEKDALADGARSIGRDVPKQ